MNRRRVSAWLWLSIMVSGCAETVAAARVGLFRDLEKRAEALDAGRVAEPDLRHYREEKARLDALPADAPERGDQASTARAYLEAAIARAERLKLADERLVLENELLAREAELTRVDEARLVQDRALGLERTREITKSELARAYARLDQHPAKRPKLSRDELHTLSKALLTRAELIAFALADDADVRAAIVAAKAAKTPEQAFAAADRALSQVLVLLAKLRAQRGPNDAEKASLVEELEAAHFTASRSELGLGVTIEEGRAAQAIAELCRIARGHPHGGVIAMATRKAELEKLAAQWKVAGCEAARLSVRAEPSESDASKKGTAIATSTSTHLVFPAY